MSAPYGQPYGGQPAPYGEKKSFPDPQQPQPEGQGPPPATGNVAEHGKKKKRAYAADAFNVGTGANVVSGQLPQPGQYGAPAQPVGPPAYGGYGAQPAEAQDVQYGNPQAIGGAPPAAAAAGYQYPDYGYPGAGAPGAGGVDAVTAGVANMGFTSAAQQPLQPQQAAQPQSALPARAGPLNQLYPTDLMSQPFNVSELELGPPPIILPPNVRPWSAGIVSLTNA